MDRVNGIRISESERSLFPNEDELKSRGDVVLKYAEVTPEVATAYLRKTNTHNRGLRKGWVATLARLMKDGRWNEGVPNIVPFAYVNGQWILLDKQHTLEAVVVSGKSIHMLLGFGFPLTAQSVIDQNNKRTLADALKLLGVSCPINNNNPAFVGTSVQAAWLGADASEDRLQVSEVVSFLRLPAVLPALKFVLENVITRNVKRYTLASVIGVFIRAYLNYDLLYKPYFENKEEFKARLRLGGKYLMEGAVGDFTARRDGAITLLRDRISKSPALHGYAGASMGRQQRREVYFLAARALDSFLKEAELKELRLPKDLALAEEPYPLPESVEENFRTDIDIDADDLIRPSNDDS
jgi:hypothetical protein